MRLNNLLRAARTPQNEKKVPFQEILPLKLKNSVSGKGDRTHDLSCLQEMTVLFACLKKTEFDQQLCNKEIQSFQKCYKLFLDTKRVKKEQEKKGLVALGTRNLTHKQINQVLRRFPNTP